MNSKGFSLVEVMITVFILAVVVALTVPAYKRIVDGIGTVSSSEDAKIDNLLALETIRLDLEHVGTGIGLNEATAPISYVEPAAPPVIPNSPVLNLNSTLVNSNQATLGWAVISCTVGTAPNLITAGDYIVDQREDTTNTDLVLLDSSENYITNTNGANYNCPDAATSGFPDGTPVLYTAFPNSNGADACATGFCTQIQYRLGAAQPLETCAVGTRNLIRAVGGAAGDTLVNCVAGFRVRFDIDTNENGTIQAPGEDDIASLAAGGAGTPLQIMNRVKNIDMYILVQVGKEDRSLNSNPTLRIDDSLGNAIVDFRRAADGGDGDWDGITNPQNYRWKIFKVSGKPNNWF